LLDRGDQALHWFPFVDRGGGAQISTASGFLEDAQVLIQSWQHGSSELRLENDHPGPVISWEGFSLFPIPPDGNVAISIVTLPSRIGQPK